MCEYGEKSFKSGQFNSKNEKEKKATNKYCMCVCV